MARLELEAMAKSYGLTRKTHFLNVLDTAGISKTQKDKGEKRAEGGGYELVLEVPLFDFGRANVREAEQRYLEAANRLGQLGVNASSEARESCMISISWARLALNLATILTRFCCRRTSASLAMRFSLSA
jgi:outer membrane protein TolC